MPQYQPPTISDFGESFKASFPVELAGNVVFVDFDTEQYTAPTSTDVDFNLSGEFESGSVEFVFEPSLTESTAVIANESASVDMTLSPNTTEVMSGGDIEIDLTTYEFGEPFTATFPLELGPDVPQGVVLDVSVDEIADAVQLYGYESGEAELDIISVGNAEKDVVVLGNAEID